MNPQIFEDTTFFSPWTKNISWNLFFLTVLNNGKKQVAKLAGLNRITQKQIWFISIWSCSVFWDRWRMKPLISVKNALMSTYLVQQKCRIWNWRSMPINYRWMHFFSLQKLGTSTISESRMIELYQTKTYVALCLIFLEVDLVLIF